MVRAAGILCLLVGCSFEHGQLTGIDARAIDASLIDTSTGCTSFSTHLDTCTMTEVGQPLVLSGTNQYSTDDIVLTTPGGDVALPSRVVTTGDGEIIVIFVSTLSLSSGATLRVVGATNDRPLGIVATGAVTIDGLIDLSDNGAGARNDSACGTARGGPGETDGGGGGGGGGGAMGTAGGKGCNGDSDSGQSMGGLAGIPIARPSHVLGGCDGGGGGDGANPGGNAGDGGGAIFIASAVSITINGTGKINAGGGGGSGGNGTNGGGGGGGSGGMIVLESGNVIVNGALAANGGGGGEGADANDGTDGGTGQASLTPAVAGMAGAGEGGDGAIGGVGSASGTTATQLKKGGGGGGGGGVGFIAIGPVTPIVNGSGIISPPYAHWP